MFWWQTFVDLTSCYTIGNQQQTTKYLINKYMKQWIITADGLKPFF